MTQTAISRPHRLAFAIAAAMLGVAGSANAGFLDERDGNPASPAAAPAPAPAASPEPAAASSTGSGAQAITPAKPVAAAPAPAAAPVASPVASPVVTPAATPAIPATVRAPVAVEPAPQPARAVASSAMPPIEAGSRPGKVDGVFTDPGWAERAPRLPAPMGVASAVSRLLPPKHSPVSIESDDEAVGEQVSWPDTNMNRKEALEYVARQYGLNIALGGGVMRIGKTRVVPGPATYSVSPADGNFRRLFKRWSAQAGYTFGDEHWTLANDIPIVAAANLGTDFKAAVRAALDSTEMTSTPARPCFYSNNVLRVVRRTELCERSK